MAVEIYKQVVSASFDVGGLGMSVTVENLPFDWDFRHGPKDDVGAGEAAKWLFANAPECNAKELTLRWVTVSKAQSATTEGLKAEESKDDQV